MLFGMDKKGVIILKQYKIAGYCRISVDEELEKENTSIENQKEIIAKYVTDYFPNSILDFYEDRDKSGYTFEQRNGYQKMRPKLMNGYYDILIVKDFSRFSRRNSKGLGELEDLRDAGVRIISIGDGIDYPTNDEWHNIQIRFLFNEMPVTDTSKKVRGVINNRQQNGKWICAVPYGYYITDTKEMTFTIDEAEAEVVRLVFDLYIKGWGYKKISKHLTNLHIPTPRMSERARREAAGKKVCERSIKEEWSIISVQSILFNDFYIGTLRQGKYTRKKINGDDVKKDESQHFVFENNHEPIVDYKTFSVAQELKGKRSTDHYRGKKKYDNFYSGFLVCGDCNSPMFSRSTPRLAPQYICGTYHKWGKEKCSSHTSKTSVLDTIIKNYLIKVRETSTEMIDRVEKTIKDEQSLIKKSEKAIDTLETQLANAKENLKKLYRQKVFEVAKKPENEELISETFDSLIDECQSFIKGLEQQLEMNNDKRNNLIRAHRVAQTAISIFDRIIEKKELDTTDIAFAIEKIFVYEDHIEVKLKADIDAILTTGKLTVLENAANFNSDTINISPTEIVQTSNNHLNKVYSVNVVSNGDPLEIYTEKDGGVIFRKYSPMSDLQDIAAQICESIGDSTGRIAAVSDRDAIIALSGAPKRELMDKPNSPELDRLMEQRVHYRYKPGDSPVRPTDSTEKYRLGVASPILSQGDLMGCVMLLMGDDSAPVTEADQKLAQTIAGFLGKQFES